LANFQKEKQQELLSKGFPHNYVESKDKIKQIEIELNASEDDIRQTP